jgi:dCTP diphosphatase
VPADGEARVRLASECVNDSRTTIAELTKLIDDFVAERQWEPFHDAKNLSASIAIEAAELMEHFQWLRSDQLDSVREDAQAMADVREEVADIAAYLLSFASKMGIDVASALEEKMRKNAVKYPAERFRGRFK